MTWELAHSVVSFAMTCIAIYMLARWRERYNLSERLGLGMIGGCGFLRINVIWELHASPFYNWAPTILSIGFALLLAGRAYRDRRHELRNFAAVQAAQSYLQSRGKR